jgi:hypothetical protein
MVTLSADRPSESFGGPSPHLTGMRPVHNGIYNRRNLTRTSTFRDVFLHNDGNSTPVGRVCVRVNNRSALYWANDLQSIIELHRSPHSLRTHSSHSPGWCRPERPSCNLGELLVRTSARVVPHFPLGRSRTNMDPIFQCHRHPEWVGFALPAVLVRVNGDYRNLSGA